MTTKKGKGSDRPLRESAPATEASTEPTLDRITQTRIGDQLRAMYDELVHQPVPDRFKDLLDRLDQGRSSGESS